MNLQHTIRAAFAGLYLLAFIPFAAQADRFVDEAEATLLNARADTRARLDAIGLLKVRSSNPQAAQVLGRALVDDRDMQVRKAAASGLWGHDHALAAESQLRRALDDHPEVSVRAAGALHAAGIDAQAVAHGFRKGLQSDNRGTAYNAARGLIGVDPPATLLPGLLNYLDWRLQRDDIQGAYSVQSALTDLASQSFDASVYSSLTAYIEEDGPGAAYALPALSSMPEKPDEFFTWLSRLSQSGNEQVRSAALTELGHTRGASTAPAVASGLLDASSDVQISAITACLNLRAAGDPCLEQLGVLLRQASNDEVRAMAAESLAGLLNDLEHAPESIWVAVRDAALEDHSAEVREYAIIAAADMPADISLQLEVLARVAAQDSVAYNKSRALGRLARMVSSPGRPVPPSVYTDVAPLTNHEDAEVARLAGLVMATR